MVLPNTHTRLKSEKQAPLLSFDCLKIPVMVHTTYLVCLSLFCAFVSLESVVAQDEDFGFVDDLAPVDASASAFHNEKFNEAEKALMEGLSRKEASQAPERQQPKLRQVSATQQQTVPKEIPKLTESSEHSDVSFRNNLEVSRARLNPVAQSPNETNAQLLKAINSQTGQQVAAPKTQVRKSAAGGVVAREAEKVAPQAAAKQKSPPDNHQVAQSKQAERPSERIASEEAMQLRRELADAKSQLAAAELEIARLSAIIQEASRSRFSLPSTGSSLVKAAPKGQISATTAAELKQLAPTHKAEPIPAPDPNQDLQVATIAVDKADLRLGPGRNHSALMSLRRGSRLAVEARQGEWYRVFAPNGQRAWIHASLVRFGDGASSLNDGSSVKVRGYDSALR